MVQIRRENLRVRSGGLVKAIPYLTPQQFHQFRRLFRNRIVYNRPDPLNDAFGADGPLLYTGGQMAAVAEGIDLTAHPHIIAVVECGRDNDIIQLAAAQRNS